MGLILNGRAQDPPSRWLWLVKWLLLVPHYVVLFFLWLAFFVLTVVAYLAVLFTGRYPRGIFDFNVGVLRWNWRVNYYGYGALGTDGYPPFSLADDPSYPARLTMDYPDRIANWRPLVQWLLAIPHIVIVTALTSGPAIASYGNDTDPTSRTTTSIGVFGALVLILALGQLFTGKRLTGIYDLLLGINRWSYRTVAYVALMTDEYPPFRLDQGDDADGPTQE